MEPDQLYLLFQNSVIFSVGKEYALTLPAELQGKSIMVITDTMPTTEQAALLSKILGSIKLELNDAAVVELDNAPPFHQIRQQMPLKKLVAFGVSPSQLGLTLRYENYQPVCFMDTDLLMAESLITIQDNEVSKSLLWKSLKKMFL